MPGTNAGTGHPLTLRCAKCRQSLWRLPERGLNLEATGRWRLLNANRPIGPIRTDWPSDVPARAPHLRMTFRLIEYRCLDCGHIGWTKHSDAERLMRPPGRTRF